MSTTNRPLPRPTKAQTADSTLIGWFDFDHGLVLKHEVEATRVAERIAGSILTGRFGSEIDLVFSGCVAAGEVSQAHLDDFLDGVRRLVRGRTTAPTKKALGAAIFRAFDADEITAIDRNRRRLMRQQ
jgi:hypothetical protein